MHSELSRLPADLHLVGSKGCQATIVDLQMSVGSSVGILFLSWMLLLLFCKDHTVFLLNLF